MSPHLTTKTYSPFWPVMGVFLTLIVLQGFYLVGDREQQVKLQAARAEIKPMLTQAGNITQTTEAIGRELVALSTNSAEAARIIDDFKIQLKPPPKVAK